MSFEKFVIIFPFAKFLNNEFMKLAERLEYYLRADEERLKDPHIFKANTEMTAYAAFFALSEIANKDDMGIHNCQAETAAFLLGREVWIEYSV